MMTYDEQYGPLLQEISDEADAIAMAHFRSPHIRVDRKDDGTALTPADGAIEEMARAKVKASGLALNVFGEEMGTGNVTTATAARSRLIIDPIDGTEEFSREGCRSGYALVTRVNGRRSHLFPLDVNARLMVPGSVSKAFRSDRRNRTNPTLGEMQS